MAKKYVVKKGDSLWKIAKDNNITLDELIRLNPTKKNMIHPNDELRLEPDKITEEINIRNERQREAKLNSTNIGAIQGYRHNGNYVIIDKKNRTLTVYDKDNNPLYTSSDFATGASGNDYNTVTYVDEQGKILNNAGNNSTPAGILEISGKGTYHGYPSFTRARINKDGTKEDVASSLHWGNIGTERNASNGCVRVGGKTLCEIEPYLSTGTRIYTLPEKEGSKFTLKGGRLNFTADNPYGIDEGDKRFWDDYNTTIDKSYSPLKLKWKKTGDEEYDNNRKAYASSIVNNKKALQQRFGLTSDEYNHLAELALGIAEQETKFGTSTSYKAKNLVGENVVSYLKGLQSKVKPKGGRNLLKGWSLKGIINYALENSDILPSILYHIDTKNTGDKLAQSRGYTQIKNQSDNKELRKIYEELGIDDNSIKQTDKSAIATIARLAYMYNNEVRGRNFKTANGNNIDPYHALMYKWLGKNYELKNKTATPNKNTYIRNVNEYSRNFDMYDIRTRNVYKNGGRIYLDEITDL